MADIEDLNPGEVASALAKAGLDATLRAHTVPTSWTPVDSVDLMAMGEGTFSGSMLRRGGPLYGS
jgi:hypothetical protein